MTEPVETRSRVFFALWPTPAEAAAMHRYARTLPHPGGRPIAPRSLHLTLAFIGEIELARLAELCALGRELSPPQWTLHFDRVGWWRRNRILWAGCAQAPAALGDLAHELNAGLKRAGLPYEERQFTVHVTLARKVRDFAPGPPPDLHWIAPTLALVASKLQPDGARYSVVERFAAETSREDGAI